MIRTRRDDGVAIVLALMAVLLLSALGSALVLTTTTETLVAASHRRSVEALYAAEAALERVAAELSITSDWNAILAGAVRAPYADGPPGGRRPLGDGSTVDVGQIVNLANCARLTPCSVADLLDNAAGDRPWADNNPVWQPYAYGPIRDFLPTGQIQSPFYVVVLVADDPSENDGNPARDGDPPPRPLDPSDPTNPGRGILVVRAEAFGPQGAHKALELTLARTDRPRRVSWRAIR
jgi:hypothetical protein